MRPILACAITLAVFACATGSSSLKSKVPAERSVLPFIEDDYNRALQQAQAKKIPIFVEAWAPW